MPLNTEMRHVHGKGFDLLAPDQALTILAQAQAEAARAVETAVPQIAIGAEMMARTITGGGRLIYVAAGSSGLMALADALELPGTYGIARDRIEVMLAGGLDGLKAMLGGPEDDVNAARADLERLYVGAGDCVIALTASGSTPYAIAAVEAARASGAQTIGLSNNADAALFKAVDLPICLTTPPEVIAGSTRMGAGTAQKIALNMLSTMMAVHLGHVHDGFMVNVLADNRKLQERAKGMVMAICGVDEGAAAQALFAADGAVKLAILLAARAADKAAALDLLAEHNGMLRPALMALSGGASRK